MSGEPRAASLLDWRAPPAANRTNRTVAWSGAIHNADRGICVEEIADAEELPVIEIISV